jgi:hypothetical protein
MNEQFTSVGEVNAEIERLLTLKSELWPDAASSLLESYRARSVTITSGCVRYEVKDYGHPWRQVTAEEFESMQDGTRHEDRRYRVAALRLFHCATAGVWLTANIVVVAANEDEAVVLIHQALEATGYLGRGLDKRNITRDMVKELDISVPKAHIINDGDY